MARTLESDGQAPTRASTGQLAAGELDAVLVAVPVDVLELEDSLFDSDLVLVVVALVLEERESVL
jgi:hypothetical protein